MDQPQHSASMDDWLVQELDRQRAAMQPKMKKTRDPDKPAASNPVLYGALVLIWGIGLGIIIPVNVACAASGATGAVTVVVMIFCMIFSGIVVSTGVKMNEVKAAKRIPTDRLVLMFGDTASAGTKVWVPHYRPSSVPGGHELYKWEPVTVGLNGAHYYENDGVWRDPAKKETWGLNYTAGAAFRDVGWGLAAFETAKVVHDAHIRHDARVWTNEVNKRQR